MKPNIPWTGSDKPLAIDEVAFLVWVALAALGPINLAVTGERLKARGLITENGELTDDGLMLVEKAIAGTAARMANEEKC